MASATYAVLALVPAVAWYLYTWLVNWRFNKFKHIPQLKSSLALGHAMLVADVYKNNLNGDSRRHADYVFEHIMKQNGNPEMLLFDIRPFNYGMLIVRSHEIAEQVSRVTKQFPYSVNKSPTLHNFDTLIGSKSILTTEGETWKSLRRRFNNGFAPSHLITLTPQILQKTSIFMSNLDALAGSGEVFEMDPLCTNLTFDIIGKVVMDIDFDAQHKSQGHDIVKHFKTLVPTYTDTSQMLKFLNVPKRITRMISGYRVDAAIKKAIIEKFSDIKSAQRTATKETRNRSVLALALQDTDNLTSDILQSTADQVKTFLFAGHDTTSILLQRLFYALSIHPKCLAKLRAELDEVFGDNDPQAVLLTQPDETIKRLSYTSACIKEGLRLWPPAGTARMAPEGSGLKLRMKDGNEVLVDGTVIYCCQWLIQRDPDVYGETADEFIPERWIGDTDTSATNKDDEVTQTGETKIPISAWRPFERGPRNCIGQELANLEARVILACVMRRYDFIKVGAGEVETDEKGQPVVDKKGVYKTKSELFNSMQITSKPFERSRMRIKLHSKAA